MRTLVSLSFLFFTSISSAITVNKPEVSSTENIKINNVITDKDFDLDMFQGCSIRLGSVYLPIKSLEKVTFSSEGIYLTSGKKSFQFDLSSSNKGQLLLQLGKKQDQCAKRVREYRRHPAY